MTMTNRYKRRSDYDRTVVTPIDDMSTTLIHEDGKFKRVDNEMLDLDTCWNDPISRDVLINLYHGTETFSNLVSIYKKSMENNEKSRAEAEKRPAENPFPYGDIKQKFIKVMVNLRVMRIVMQNNDDSVSSDNTTFTLSPFGRQFVTRNLMDMIKDESFGLIVLMMAENKQSIYLSHVIMKIMEMKKTPFDQLISIVDDLQPSVNDGKPLISTTIIDEYMEYLKNVEGESNKNVAEIQSSVMRKMATLVQKGLVAADQAGSYSLTKNGDTEASKFWDGVKGWFYFMRDARLWRMDKDETGRFQVQMLAEGIELAAAMKNDFENDDDRIAKGIMLDDVDDHEARAVLPVHQVVKKEKESKKALQTTIYIVEHGKMGFIQNIRENMNAIAGGAVVFGILLMVFGFVMTGVYPVEGMIILMSSMLVMCFGGATYRYTLLIVKTGRNRNKSEAKIVAELSKQKMKEMGKPGKNDKTAHKKVQKIKEMRCCFCMLAAAAVMILLVLSMAGSP